MDNLDNIERFALLSPEKRELLLRKLMERHTDEKAASAINTDEKNKYTPFPLAEVQQVYWLGQTGLFDLGTHPSNVYIEFRINLTNKSLRTTIEDRVIDTLNLLIRDHDILRLIILPGGMQKILPEVDYYRIPFADLGDWGENEIEEKLEEVRTQMREEQTPVLEWPLFKVAGHCFNHTIVVHVKINSLLMDGTSIQIFLTQWLAAIQNSYITIDKPQFSYRDYALSWETIKKTYSYQQSRNYWLNLLPGLLPGPELPLRSYVQPDKYFKFIVYDNELIDKEGFTKLNQLAVKFGVGVFSVLLTAYADVLACWSYGAKFSLGVINSFRPPVHPQINDILGNFNTVEIVAIDSLRGNFIERVKAVQAQIVYNIDNPYFSGLQVIREINKKYGQGSHVPLKVFFNSVLNLQKDALLLAKNERMKHILQTASQREENSLINVEIIEDNIYASQMQLVPSIYEGTNGEIRCKWAGRPEMFPQGMMEEMFNVYKKLINNLVSEDKIWHRRWPENISSLVKYDDRSVINIKKISDMDINDLFRQSVSRHSNHVAVAGPLISLTYEDLYDTAGIIRDMLFRAGVKPGNQETVAVIMEHGWEQIVSILGIFGAGAVFLPLDVSMPYERLSGLLRENCVKVVLTQSWISQQIGLIDNVENILVDKCTVGNSTVCEPVARLQADQTACIIYPAEENMHKVIISQSMMVNIIISSNQYFGVNAEDRLLSIYTNTVDLWLYDVLGMLIAGGTIFLPQAQSSWNPLNYAELIKRHQITVFNAPVYILEETLTCWDEHFNGGQWPLRLIFLSGTRVGNKIVTRIKNANSGSRIFHLWRTPQIGLWSMVAELGVNDDVNGAKFDRCYEGRNVYVLNDGLEQCPYSVLGHVYIGGDDLIQTHTSLSNDNGVKVVCNPRTDERLIKTRYVGRYSASNLIEICGNEADCKLRFRGYSISLFDIAEKLEQHPDVRSAFVQAVETLNSNDRLTAYAVIRDSSLADADSLKIFLQDKLPYYAIPNEIYLAKSLPIRMDGYIDNNRLSQSLLPNIELKPFIQPRDQIEARLLKMWDNILGERQIISINDNWFDVGGDSLKWVQLKFLIEREFGIALAPGDFIKDATIEHLAGLLRQF